MGVFSSPCRARSTYFYCPPRRSTPHTTRAHRRVGASTPRLTHRYPLLTFRPLLHPHSLHIAPIAVLRVYKCTSRSLSRTQILQKPSIHEWQHESPKETERTNRPSYKEPRGSEDDDSDYDDDSDVEDQTSDEEYENPDNNSDEKTDDEEDEDLIRGVGRRRKATTKATMFQRAKMRLMTRPITTRWTARRGPR